MAHPAVRGPQKILLDWLEKASVLRVARPAALVTTGLQPPRLSRVGHPLPGGPGWGQERANSERPLMSDEHSSKASTTGGE
jgi:hypothetical protein